MIARLLASATFVLLLGAGNAYACACCADTAAWSERTARLQPFERSELARVRFAAKAADVPSPAADRVQTYRATGALSGKTWRIALSGLPALTFAAPTRATFFGVDLRERPGEPRLYKELRLSGAAAGPGTRYRLILQGRGNSCLAAEDFTHWRLEVTGGRRKLTVFGDLLRPR